MTTFIDGNSSRSEVTSIDDTDSPYTTQDESTINVDTTNGAVTITLASADVQSGQPIEIFDVGENASTNNITINTEASETINPGSNSSITITVDGAYVELKSNGSNWYSDRIIEKTLVESPRINTAEINGAVTGNNTLNDITGTNLSISGGALNASGVSTAIIDDTDSPFTTSDEDIIYANTTNGAITVTFSSADATDGNEIEVVNVAGTNAVTVNTEGSETIDPNADSSKTLNNAGWKVGFTSDGTNWDSSLAAELESVSTDTATIDAKVGIGIPATSTDGSGTFDTWRQASATRPAYVVVATFVETDGSLPANTRLDVDESGGTTADYELSIADIPPEVGAGGNQEVALGILLPAGAQYQIANVNDPNSSNAITEERVFVL